MPGDALVRVHAAGINRADLLQRAGKYPAPPGVPPDIPGIEFAGEVVSVMDETSSLGPGDRVFGLAGGGACAELLTVPARSASRLPDSIGWVDAGAAPEAFITSHDALITQAHLVPNERVLIHAVGSGVGLAAMQLVRERGAYAFGTTRTHDKLERARALGLRDGLVIGDDPSGLSAAVAGWTHSAGVQLVMDLVGGAYTPASLAVLAPRGRLILVGLVAGAQATIDLRRVLSQRLTIIGTVLRSRGRDEKIAVAEAFGRDVVPLLAAGRVRPVIDSVFPLDAIADAHRRMESNQSFGKIVLTM
jgi:NADPH:quinone reductase-like Zn-dependent oxidoreductase